jgi:hypothetical protein
VTLAEAVARIADLRADYAHKEAHMNAAAVLDDVLGLLEQVDGMETATGGDRTTHQAAEMLGLSFRTVERMCRTGAFPGAYKTSRANGTGDWRIPTAGVEGFRRSSGQGREARALAPVPVSADGRSPGRAGASRLGA